MAASLRQMAGGKRTQSSPIAENEQPAKRFRPETSASAAEASHLFDGPFGVESGKFQTVASDLLQDIERWISRAYPDQSTVPEDARVRIENTRCLLQNLAALEDVEKNDQLHTIASGGNLVGLCVMRHEGRKCKNDSAYIEYLVSHPGYVGAGRQLLEHAEEVSRKMGQEGRLCVVPLEGEEDDTQAEDFFDHFDFKYLDDTRYMTRDPSIHGPLGEKITE